MQAAGDAQDGGIGPAELGLDRLVDCLEGGQRLARAAQRRQHLDQPRQRCGMRHLQRFLAFRSTVTGVSRRSLTLVR